MTSTAENHETPNDAQQSPERPKKFSRRMIKKRTKTGCLTCRKRRIKCGEQRPHCLQCLKSGRTCDYNARLSFRRYPFNQSASQSSNELHEHTATPSYPMDNAFPMPIQPRLPVRHNSVPVSATISSSPSDFGQPPWCHPISQDAFIPMGHASHQPSPHSHYRDQSRPMLQPLLVQQQHPHNRITYSNMASPDHLY